MQKIAIAGEIYSPNLGDGVIHQSLVHLYRKLSPTLQITPVDISAREGWNTSPQQPVKANLSRIGRQTLPSIYRWLNVFRLAVNYLSSWKKRWSRLLMDTDALIIGGGQLLMDNELDFPFKLHLLTSLAKEVGIPYYLQAVGAGSRWSRTGGMWMRTLLQNASGISLRDEASKHNVYSLCSREDVRLAADPAVWAEEVYGKPALRRSGWVGVGLLNWVDFHTHQVDEKVVTAKTYRAFWLEVGKEFLRRGINVEFFTNGNLLDESLAKSLMKVKIQPEGEIHIAKRPVVPAELVERVSSYQAIFSARLHANLLAGVYGIPAVGLSWDTKVNRFYREMGCEERVVDYHQDSPREIVERLLSLPSGVPVEKIDAAKALVWEDVRWIGGQIGIRG